MIAKMSASAISPELMTELSILGGILITASGLNLLNIKDCKVLNMIPAFLVPPVFFFPHALFA